MIDNKVVFITGAAQRVGAQVVEHLHSLGMNIILHYRNSVQEAKSIQDKLNLIRSNSVALLQADLDDINSISDLVANAQKQWGRLDVLINNASRFYPTPVGSVSETQWDDLFGSNLKAPFFLAQAAAPYLKVQQGCIVNMVDIHAERPLKGHPVYCAAKAGTAMLTKALACELGPEIRVNGIAPGAILWPKDMNEEGQQRIVNKTFLKCSGSPLDIAKAIQYLILDANYITGQIIAIDGGRSLNS